MIGIVERQRSIAGLVAILVLGACAGGTVEPQASATFPSDDGGATSLPPTTADDDDAGSAADGQSSSSSTSGGEAGDVTTSGQPAESSGALPPAPGWLLTVDDSGEVARLLRIDTGTAQATQVCAFAAGIGFDSLAITRADEIYGHDPMADMIRRIDPCTCSVTDVMPSGGPMQITADDGDGLYGLRTQTGELIAIDPLAGTFSAVGDLGTGFADGAIAWSDDINAVYAVSGDTDQLFFVNPGNTVSLVTMLGRDLTRIGLDYHPGTELLYVCSTTPNLMWIDTMTGGVVEIAAINGASECDDLAAPFAPVACVPD